MSDERSLGMLNEGGRSGEEMAVRAPDGNSDGAEGGHAALGADGNPYNPLDPATLDMLREGMKTIVEVLPKNEAEIIFYHFGVIDGQPHSIDETCYEFGIAPERIRQIESKLLATRCRALHRSTLKDYLED